MNWAQVSGTERQRIAVTPRTGWTKRWGAAVAVIENTPETEDEVIPENERSRIYVMGGDDYAFVPGGGSYRNDIWMTTGVNTVAVNSPIERNQYGDLLPRIVSKLRWLEISGDRTPPRNVDYREWLCCLPGLPWRCASVSCDPIDPYEGVRRWSPRRDHQAVVMENSKIFVMGGRARALEDIPEREAIGGIIGARGRWREKSVLMSDVWLTTDGSSWTLVNPGCYVPQADLTDPPGVWSQECATDADCQQRRLGSTRCVSGSCVCSMWSPRERFAAAAVGTTLYVMGGVTYITQQRCARIACGEGYTRYLNDVWRSGDDGRVWEPIQPQAPWRPRGEFGLVVAGGLFWVMGGRGGDVAVYDNNPLFNDVWWSANGIEWVQNLTAASWSPRSAFRVVSINDRVFVFGGREEVEPLPSPAPLSPVEQVAKAAAEAPVLTILPIVEEPVVEPERDGETVSGLRVRVLDELWSWDLKTPGSYWIRDFEPGTVHEAYFRATASAQHVLNLTAQEAAMLAAEDIVSVEDLALAEGDVIRRLRDPNHFGKWPEPDGSAREVCFFKQWAEALHDRCAVRPRAFDGEWVRSAFVVEGNEATDIIAAFGGYYAFGGQHTRPDDSARANLAAQQQLAAAIASASSSSSSSTTSTTTSTTSSSTTASTTSSSSSSRRKEAPKLGGADGCEDRAPSVSLPEVMTDVACREVPHARHSMAMAEMDDRLYVLAGYEAVNTFAQDVWYRDEEVPNTVISVVPPTGSSDTVFDFSASEPGCIFEWRLFTVRDLNKGYEYGTGDQVRNWSRQLPPIDVLDDVDDGYYRIEVRAIDPAGNRDYRFLPAINMYVWEYVPPLPWLLISMMILLFIAICIFAFWYYRRWKRLKAMERYAMKRLQRKLRAVQEGDWRKFYDGDGKKKKKKGKKSRKEKEREKRSEVSNPNPKKSK